MSPRRHVKMMVSPHSFFCFFFTSLHSERPIYLSISVYSFSLLFFSKALLSSLALQAQDPVCRDSSLHDEQNRHGEPKQKKKKTTGERAEKEAHRGTRREGGEASPFSSSFERNQFRVSSIRAMRVAEP